jgi:FecR protein
MASLTASAKAALPGVGRHTGRRHPAAQKMKYVVQAVIPMDRTLTILSVVALVFTCAWPVSAQTPAGRIKTVSGTVFVIRQNAPIPAQVSQALLESDSVKTGADGRLGIMLKDETRLALGPNSEVRIDQFVYSPGQGRLRLAMKIVSGIVAYVSGRIAKLSPDAVRLETPSAILGVRGTQLVIRVGAP